MLTLTHPLTSNKKLNAPIGKTAMVISSNDKTNLNKLNFVFIHAKTSL